MTPLIGVSVLDRIVGLALVFTIILALVIPILWLAGRQLEQMKKEARRVALKLGCTRPPVSVVKGSEDFESHSLEHKGVRLTIDAGSKVVSPPGSGKLVALTVAVVSAELRRPLPFELEIRRRVALDPKPVLTGVRKFDKACCVTSSDPERAQRLLSDRPLQERIMRFLETSRLFPTARSAVTGRAVESRLVRPRQIRKACDRTARLAARLSEAWSAVA